MLRKLHVHNFKTLLDFTFEPEPISLLIGRNNVGKTSVCQALRFLSLTTSMRLLNACVAATGSGIRSARLAGVVFPTSATGVRPAAQ